MRAASYRCSATALLPLLLRPRAAAAETAAMRRRRAERARAAARLRAGGPPPFAPAEYLPPEERACAGKLLKQIVFANPSQFAAGGDRTSVRDCHAATPSTPLFFSRIPKTGSTLLRRLVHERTQATNVSVHGEGYQVGGHALLRALGDADSQRSVYTPHSAFGLHRVIAGAPCCYVTVLRAPFDRMVSLYYESFSDTGTLADFLLACNGSFAYHNMMTVQLCGTARECVADPPRALATARANLRRCYVAGTLDTIDATLRRFHARYPDVFPAHGVDTPLPVVRRGRADAAVLRTVAGMRASYDALAWADVALFNDVANTAFSR